MQNLYFEFVIVSTPVHGILQLWVGTVGATCNILDFHWRFPTVRNLTVPNQKLHGMYECKKVIHYRVKCSSTYRSRISFTSTTHVTANNIISELLDSPVENHPEESDTSV